MEVTRAAYSGCVLVGFLRASDKRSKINAAAEGYRGGVVVCSSYINIKLCWMLDGE